MIFTLALMLVTILPCAPVFQQQITASDLKILTGAQWAGTLTYRDYSSDKMVSIPSTLTVTEVATGKLTWEFKYEYPAEPKANGVKTVAIRDEGRLLGDEKVVERRQLATDVLKIVTEKRGKDNDRDALFRFTYLIGGNSFSITKEVQYKGGGDFLARNQYTWIR